jgi:hypothetical protein
MRGDCAKRRKCSEKDTSRNKLLQCDDGFRRNVTYFAGSLSKAMGNWRFHMQAASKASLRLFFINETTEQTASIFLMPPSKDNSES